MKLEKEHSNKITNERINELEKKYDVNIPQSYRDFLLQTNGGVVDIDDPNSEFWINDINDVILATEMFGLDTESDGSNMMVFMDMFRDDLIEQTVLIGDTASHGFIILICEGEYQGVYYWDDCFSFEQSTEDCNTYWITDTFEHFMNHIIVEEPQ